MLQLKFPKRVEDLSADLLTQALADMRPGVEVEDFSVIETINCESGFASTADRVVLDLHYREGTSQGLPSRVLLKTMLIAPHAPGVMYAAEVRFYRELSPTLKIEAPQAYAGVADEPSGQFGILMEDLSLRDVVFPNATMEISLDQVHSVLRNLAIIHAQYWESPRLADDLAWLCTPAGGGVNDFFKEILPLIQGHLDAGPWRQEMLEPLGRSAESLFTDMLRIQETALEHGPRTLLHGDTHLGNTYLVPDGTVGLLDFQLTMQGCFSRDLTYFLMTALDTERRRQHEADLIRFYLDELRSRGVSNAPSFDDAWLLHRQSALWGLVIGWMTCPTENYGRKITEANLQRLIAAVDDLDALNVVPD